MRIDAISIFPNYFLPLNLSLPGKAQESGLVNFQAHDLRNWATDRHRTVDDTPYGGGAGMVMKPEPWGQALDEVAVAETVVIVPTPSGQTFDHASAVRLAQESHLVFACGRYEGIDERVMDFAKSQWRVEELSLGNFVLNGGEVAAIAMIEAIIRLLPGFMGNPESLVEESHVDGNLEYPVYTKPASWRGFDVPEVLLSGHHQKVAEWRAEQSRIRTQNRQAQPESL